MNYKPQNELLSAYFDHETTPDEAAVAEQLLHLSESARSEFEDIRELSEQLKSLPPKMAPEEFAPSVLKRAERESLLDFHPPEPSRALRWRSWSLVAGGLLTATATLLTAVHYFAGPVNETTVVRNDVPPALETSAVAPSDIAEVVAKTLLAEETLPPPAANVPAIESFSAIDFRNVGSGDVISYLDRSGDRVSVIKLTVIDVTKAVGQTRVLLSNNSIPELVDETSRVHSTDEKTNELRTVFVQTTGSQLVSALGQMQHREVFVNLALEPPVAVAHLVTNHIDEPTATRTAHLSRVPTKSPENRTVAQAIDRAMRLRKTPSGKSLNRRFAQPTAKRTTETKTDSPANSFQLHVKLNSVSMNRKGGAKRKFVENKDHTNTPKPHANTLPVENQTELVRVFFVFEQRTNSTSP